MKKLLSFATVLLLGTTLTFAQSATSTTTTTTPVATQNVEKAIPAVNAAEMAPTAQCKTGGSCCHGANKSSAIMEGATAPVPTEGVGVAAAPAPGCHSTEMSMSAGKAEPAPVEDPQK